MTSPGIGSYRAHATSTMLPPGDVTATCWLRPHLATLHACLLTSLRGGCQCSPAVPACCASRSTQVTPSDMCSPQHRCSPIHAPCGNGLLISPPDRLKQLIHHQPIHDYYIVSDQPFARGQFASVRECTHRDTGERFAAKVLKKRRRLCDIYHEIAVLDALSPAPNIIGLQQVFETTAEIIIVLELAVGGELQTTLDVEPTLTEDEVVRLMQQILHGLQLLHHNSIAHLDLKPQNILLTGPFDTGQVKLCDFGISRVISPNIDLREIMGTADYMAPETLNYESLSLATDMWSVGVLSYVLLTGCAPFTGCGTQETYCNITSQAPDFPDQLFGHVSSCAQNFISQLLLKNPRDRLTVDQCLRHPWITQQLQLPRQLVGCDSSHAAEKVRKDSGFNSPGVSDVETDEMVEDDGEEDGAESVTELTPGCGQRSRKLNCASAVMSGGLLVHADDVRTLKRPTTARTADVDQLDGCSGVAGTSETHRCLTDSVSETHRCLTDSVSDTHRNLTDSVSETHRCLTDSVSETHRSLTDSVSETHRSLTDSVSETHRCLTDSMSETHRCLTDSMSETHRSLTDSVSETHRCLTDSMFETHRSLTDSVSETHRCLTDSVSETHRCLTDSVSETHRSLTDSVSETHRCLTDSVSETYRSLTDSVSETHRCLTDSMSETHTSLTDSVSETHTILTDSVSDTNTSLTASVSETLSCLTAPVSETLSCLRAPVSETLSCLTAPVSETLGSCVSDSLCDETSRVFCFNSLSVSHLTDRIWDCFDAHAFRMLPFRPWQNVCTGVADRARENFLRKSLPLKRRNQRKLHHSVSRPSSPIPS